MPVAPIADRITQLRSAGWSMSALSRLTGVSRPALHAILRDQSYVTDTTGRAILDFDPAAHPDPNAKHADRRDALRREIRTDPGQDGHRHKGKGVVLHRRYRPDPLTKDLPATAAVLGRWGAGTDEEPENWRSRALCAQTDTESFFPEKGGNNAAAKAVCGRCPVASDCLEHALFNGEHHGVWGGKSPKERDAMMRRRGLPRSSPPSYFPPTRHRPPDDSTAGPNTSRIVHEPDADALEAVFDEDYTDHDEEQA
jgi:WhiB family redox-sensing transcriptional regulator